MTETLPALYVAKDYSQLKGIAGFSDTMLSNHVTLYTGYVTNANKLIGLLNTVERGGYEYAELKRRLAWEINGIKLHELYFDNMSATTTEPSENVMALLSKEYGSFDEWKASLKRNGLTRGIGWVVLVREDVSGAIFHTWIGEHSHGTLIGVTPLLVMDCWEHAYMTDYGIKRGDYIDNFIQAIDWGVVEKRLK